jgi:predicted nucleic acid-binding protein
MSYLLDTNILVRLANSADIRHSTAVRAVIELHRRGESLHVAPQSMIEFRNVATRPLAANGLALSTTDTQSLIAAFEASFPILEETPAIYPAWKHLVDAIGVIGKQVHDARLVAVCHAQRITHLLTFNIAHFARLSTVAPGLVIVEPTKV